MERHHSRPSSASSRLPLTSPTPSMNHRAAGGPGGAGAGGKPGKQQKRQRVQEEFAAVPSCPMLYALIPPELQPTQQQLQSQKAQQPKLEHNLSLARLDSGSLPGSANGTPARGGAPPRTITPAMDPPHIRVRSWDVNDLSRQMLTEGGQPWVCRLPFSSLSLAAECLVNSAMVTLEATWTVDDVALPVSHGGALDCLFVLPLNDQATVCGVEVLPGPTRMLATAVVSNDEGRMAARHAELSQHQGQHKDGDKSGSRGSGPAMPQRMFNRSFTNPGQDQHQQQTAQQQQQQHEMQNWSPGKAGVKLRSLSHRRLFAKRDSNASHESSSAAGTLRDERMATIPSSRSSEDTDNATDRASAQGSRGYAEASPSGREGENENASKVALASSALLTRRVEPQIAATLLQDPDGFCPCLFRLHVPKVSPGTSVQVRITYLETMQLQPGSFNEITVPLTVPWDCVPPDVPLHEVVRVSCMINSGIHQPMKIGDFNHPMKVLFVELGRATFVGYPDPDDPESWPNAHFTASYQVSSEEAHAGALVQAPVVAAQDPRATVCLTLCLPDAPTTEKPLFPRAVVFVIDSSASLRSRQMDDARRAIASALKRLGPKDMFMLVAFDYELLTSADNLEEATPENIKRACKFVLRAHDCDKPSNIFTPLDLALQVLKSHCQESSDEEKDAAPAATPLLPQIVLVTDTSVQDERRICRHVQTSLLEWGRNPPRIFTFGIGQGCNFYFLKWLSSVSRGTTTMSYNIEEVRTRLDKVLHAMSRPAVTNVTVKELPAGCELYPYPIPDLYLGVPIVVTGKMGSIDEDGEGQPELGLPSHLHLRGLFADGSIWRSKAQLVEAGNVPLNSVGIQEQLEILSADAWLHEDQALDELVTSLSMSASVPSENTSMVYFETTSKLFLEFQKDRVQGTRGDVQAYTEPHASYLVQVPGLHRGFGRSSHLLGMREDILPAPQAAAATATTTGAAAAAGSAGGRPGGRPSTARSTGVGREGVGNGPLPATYEPHHEEALGNYLEEKLDLGNNHIPAYPVTKSKGLFNLQCYFPKYGDNY